MQFLDRIDNLYFLDGILCKPKELEEKDIFSSEQGFVNTKVFLNFFKINEREIAKELCEERDRTSSQIKNCIWRFSNFGAKIEEKDFYELVPFHLIQKLTNQNLEIWQNLYSEMRNRNGFDKFYEYYVKNKSSFDTVYELKRNFNFGDLSFEFAENFRFKTVHGFFNPLNLKKEDREQIAPGSKDYFVFSIDYKQFEFRTFLDLIGYDKEIFSVSIYDYLAKKLNVKSDDVKVEIIAWLYSNRNVAMLDEHLDKHRIINKVIDGLFDGCEEPIWVGQAPNNKIVHTVVQTKSQFFYLSVLRKILNFLEDKKSVFVSPLHDTMIFFIHNDEVDIIEKIVSLAENDVYKVKSYVGKNYKDIEEI